MRLTRFLAASLVAVAMLAACGGGDGVPRLTINGVAANGAAAAGKPVVIKCAIGDPVGTTIDASGALTREMTSHVLPCMAQVDGTAAGRLHGVALAAGRFNITPLTELIVGFDLK